LPFLLQEKNGISYHSSASFVEADGVFHGFSNRLGGVSEGALSSLNLGRSRDDEPAAVAENHRRFAAALGTDFTHLVLPQQIHSDRVCTVTMDDALPELYTPSHCECDGLITNCKGLTLAIFYADCIPVLLYDPKKQVIGAVHSGWRGTSLEIAAKAAAQMCRDFGCEAEDILAAIGPGICPVCFETHDDVPTAMQATMGDKVAPFVTPLPFGKFQVDLKGIIAKSLADFGLKTITTLPLCTACQPDLFWSHRVLGEARGNQAAVIQLMPT